MPQGIGYGPLPPPPGLATAPGLPRLTPAPPVDLSLLATPQPQPLIPTELMPAPVLPEEQQQLPPPPGLAQEQRAAPVPTWLQDLLAQRQPDSAAPATSTQQPTDGVAASSAGAATSPDPRDPVALATAGADARVRAEQTALAEMRAADEAIARAAENQQRREAERAERERIARERVAEQNAAIQQALKQGPGTTWRDVAATGTQALFAVLGAAFDRSGMLQKALPNTLSAIVQQGQERTQEAFKRQLQALQVGREGAQDELDAAMDDERRIEQAGAAAQKAILDESQRQIDIAMGEGKVTLAQLEAAGIPAQMEAMRAAAEAKQQKLLEDESFQREKREADLAKTQADTAATKAKVRQEWASLNLRKQELLNDKRKTDAEIQRGLADEQRKGVELAIAQGNLAAQQREYAVVLPDRDQPIIANSKEARAKLADMTAGTERLARLMDEIRVATKRTDGREWIRTSEGQRQLSRWSEALLAIKTQRQLGALDKGAVEVAEGILGPDPTKLSWDNFVGQADRYADVKRRAEDELDAYLRANSTDYAQQKRRVNLPDFETPEGAVPTASEAVKALLPGVSGKRPRLVSDGTNAKGAVTASEYSGAIKTVRETIAKEVASGERHDELFSDRTLGEEDVLRVQATELANSLKSMRAERQKLEQERTQTQQQARGRGPESAALLKRAQEITSEIATVQQYEQRLGKELERERRLLDRRIYARPGVKRTDVNPADQAAYDAVTALIGGLN